MQVKFCYPDEYLRIYGTMYNQLIQLQLNSEVENRFERRRKRYFHEFKNYGDNVIFENLAETVFCSGFSARKVTRNWHSIKKAFCDFDVEQVALFNEKNILDVLNAPVMIRNEKKIEAVVVNARKIKKLQEEYGSFCKFIENYEKDLFHLATILQQFSFIGPATAWDFMRAIGLEAIKPDVHVIRVMHRIGLISSNERNADTNHEVFEIAKRFSKVSGERLAVIDALFWYYGADQPEEVQVRLCGSKPKCHLCDLRDICHYFSTK